MIDTAASKPMGPPSSTGGVTVSGPLCDQRPPWGTMDRSSPEPPPKTPKDGAIRCRLNENQVAEASGRPSAADPRRGSRVSAMPAAMSQGSHGRDRPRQSPRTKASRSVAASSLDLGRNVRPPVPFSTGQAQRLIPPDSWNSQSDRSRLRGLKVDVVVTSDGGPPCLKVLGRPRRPVVV